MPRVFLSVAEPSADASAALLARELRALCPDVTLEGLGGPALQGAGVELLAETVSNAAMGLAAVWRAWEVSRLLGRVREAWGQRRPDLLVCTDSWSFHVHLCRLAKSMGVPVLYYIAPQTWASREGRVRTLAAVVDKLACILPFEEAYFRGFGVDATYVGHPLWDRLPEAALVADRERAAGERLGVRERPVVGVLPGSRRGVARANWPRLRRVMEQLRGKVPGVRFRVPLTVASRDVVRPESLAADTVAELDAVDKLIGGVGLAGGDGVEGEEVGGGGACDVCVCVSGTAALHVAAYTVPMVVVYHGNPVLWHLVGRWVVRTRTYSLVNLLSGGPERITYGRHIVPEFIPWYGPVEPVVEEVTGLLKDGSRRAAMRAELARVVEPLARRGASRRAAELAAELLQRRS